MKRIKSRIIGKGNRDKGRRKTHEGGRRNIKHGRYGGREVKRLKQKRSKKKDMEVKR